MNPVQVVAPQQAALGFFQKASNRATDFWSKTSAGTAGERLVFSAAIAIICGVIIFACRPPMIRDKSDVPYRAGKVSFLKISIWSLIVFIVSFALMNFL